MLNKLRMNWKITILSFGIVLFAICIGGIIIMGNIIQLKEEELGKRLLVTGMVVAQLPSVKEGIINPNKASEINSTVEHIRIINDMDYIVVMNMDGVRLTHPLSSQIGTVSKGLDERSAFAEHTYLSKAKGELGKALRGFVPVMNENHEQIGVVLVGHLLPRMSQILSDMIGQVYITILLSLLFGALGSWLLAGHIKKQMFQLEPQEIARLLVERTATFHAMHEGVIAIDSSGKITIFNEKAKQMLKIEENVIGQPIQEVISDTRLPEILQKNEPIYNQEFQIGPTLILSNRVPIKVGEQTVGAVAIFQDRTEMTRLAEELTGVKQFVDALRVQNHEYMNKLHTIGGLIQLDHKEKALDYLFHITEQRTELMSFLNRQISDENISGLLLGKISRGKELGIEVSIDRQSRVETFPALLDHHDIAVLLGNLIENAFDSLKNMTGDVNRDKYVFISLEQDDNVFSILVEDNGSGMEQAILERIFERGFTTKQGAGRGIGLYLIHSIIEKGNGDCKIDSVPSQGTSFIITFPMTGKAEA
ncbi:putative C4-dicarboxylate sensor kinase [Paenibacillus baekrokdamisoli]|uniref:histidine kinase n=1 Tax=Paenibacillus baekrokdamisoli TaxID=1712516 RepID=A0A3G9J4S9_9BACL|nr:sensor histidine kinase [Paenibacillus baekrokdamisoli]MBB3069364.1 two-component system sensor histidine kinase DctS [Paenibacillus baekrokdamisoli]BBH18668.1 putative C4-dicarboxylate sensor kinase [Paenibacillus baekrokdamisoli]